MSKYDKENPFTAFATIGKGYQTYLNDIRVIYEKMAKIKKRRETTSLGRQIVQGQLLFHDFAEVSINE